MARCSGRAIPEPGVVGQLYSAFMVAWGDAPTWLLVGLGGIGGGAALRQLSLQRQQLRDQQEVIRSQAQILERQQANKIDVRAIPVDGADAGVLANDVKSEQVHMVVVGNGSDRPIREVVVRVAAILGTDRSIRHERLANVYGEIVPYAAGVAGARLGGDWSMTDTFVFKANADTMPVLRSGHKAGFVWGFTLDRYPEIVPTARFTDDAGLHWQINADLHLERLAERDW